MNHDQFQNQLTKLLNNNKHAERIYVIALHFENKLTTPNEQLDEFTAHALHHQITNMLIDQLKPFSLVGHLADNIYGIAVNYENLDLLSYLKSLKHLFETPIIINGRVFSLTPYLGASAYPTDAMDAKSLIYEALLSVEYGFNPKMKKNIPLTYLPSPRNITPSDTMPTRVSMSVPSPNMNFEQYGFQLYYQPQFSPKTHDLKGFEIKLKVPQTNKFFALIDNLLIAQIDNMSLLTEIQKQLIVHATLQIQQWQEIFSTSFYLEINMSSQFLLHPETVTFFADLIQNLQINPENILLALSEKMWLGDINKLKETMKILKIMGFKIELNDFGNGYSSLNYLTRLPFDVIKTDVSHLSNTLTVAKGYKILKSIVALCKSMGLFVIAKGIEQENLLFLSEDIGSDLVQGGFLSPSLNNEAIIKLLAKTHHKKATH